MMNPNTLSMFDGLGALGDVGSGGKGGVGVGTGGAKPGFQPAASSTPDYSAPPANVGEGQQVSSNDPNYGKATYAPPVGGKQFTSIPPWPGKEPPIPLWDPGNMQDWAAVYKKSEYKSGGFTITVPQQYAQFQKGNAPIKSAWDTWLWKAKNAAEFVGVTPAYSPPGLPTFSFEQWVAAFHKKVVTSGFSNLGEMQKEYNAWSAGNNAANLAFSQWKKQVALINTDVLEAAAKKRGLIAQYAPAAVANVDLTLTKDLTFDDPAALAVIEKANYYFKQLAPMIGVTQESYQKLVAFCKTKKFWTLKDAQDLLNYVVEANDVAPILVKAYSVFKGTLPLAVDGNPYPMTEAQYNAAALDARGGGEWWDWSVKLAQNFLNKVTDTYNKAKKWSDDKVKAQDVAITAALSDADTSFAEMQKYIKPLSGLGSINNPNIWTPDQYANAKNTAKGSAWSTVTAKTFRDKVLAQTALAKQWYLTYTPPATTEQPPAPVTTPPVTTTEQPPAPVTTPPVTTTTSTTTPVTTTTSTTTTSTSSGGGGGSMWSFAPPTPEVTVTPPTTPPPAPPPIEEKKSGFVPLAAIGAIAWALLKK